MTTADRTGQAAADYARARVGDTMPDEGLCLQFTRQNFAVASYYYSAADAWNAARYRHVGDRRPPVGTPVFFNSSSIYNHVCITVEPDGGEVVSTWNDDIRLYPSLDATEDAFGPYQGWTEDLNTVRVYVPPPPPEPEPPDILEVGEMFVTTYGSSAYRLVTGGHIVGISGGTYDKLRKAGVPAVSLANDAVEHLTDVLIGEDGKIGGKAILVKPV